MQPAQALPPLVPLPPELPCMLTVAEVAAALRVDASTVYRAVADGRVRAVRLGSKKASAVRIPRAELERILEEEAP